MPNFTAGTSFTDGVTNDVTALKLNALVADAVPTSSLALASTSGTISNFTSSTATLLGAITGSTNVINIGSGQIYKDASGFVGIGTTSQIAANAKINVVGGHIAVSDDSYLLFGNSATGIQGSTANNRMIFYTNSAERLRIDSSGNLLLGGTTNNANARFISENESGNQVGIRYTGQVTYYLNATSTQALAITKDGTERLRIDSNGRLLIGATSAISAGVRLGVNFTGGGTEYGMTLNAETLNTGTQWIEFTSGSVGSTTARGSIDWSGTAVRFNTSSDYRLKENIVEISDGIERLKQLKPSKFNFIEYPDKTVDGFIAHEVHDIIPEAVSGEKDAVDADGKPIYQGIDQSKIVPLLTAALKEAIAKIETLESKVTALEAA
jgi:hypothetical protein